MGNDKILKNKIKKSLKDYLDIILQKSRLKFTRHL